MKSINLNDNEINKCNIELEQLFMYVMDIYMN